MREKKKRFKGSTVKKRAGSFKIKKLEPFNPSPTMAINNV